MAAGDDIDNRHHLLDFSRGDVMRWEGKGDGATGEGSYGKELIF